MSWSEELTRAMDRLAVNDQVIFVGQSTIYPGHLMYQTLKHIPEHKKLELPVIENTQLGLCLGLALSGLLPVCIFPRLDFLIIAADQLVNHLDKWASMGGGSPKIVVRSMPGSTNPIYSGPQHSGNYIQALRLLCPHITVLKITQPEHVYSAYQRALEEPGPFILIEAPPKRMGYEG